MSSAELSKSHKNFCPSYYITGFLFILNNEGVKEAWHNIAIITLSPMKEKWNMFHTAAVKTRVLFNSCQLQYLSKNLQLLLKSRNLEFFTPLAFSPPFPALCWHTEARLEPNSRTTAPTFQISKISVKHRWFYVSKLALIITREHLHFRHIYNCILSFWFYFVFQAHMVSFPVTVWLKTVCYETPWGLFGSPSTSQLENTFWSKPLKSYETQQYPLPSLLSPSELAFPILWFSVPPTVWRSMLRLKTPLTLAAGGMLW